MKTEIKKFNENYNIVKIYRDKTIDFYLEKVNYGHLYYICGVYEDIELARTYVLDFIFSAELENFWSSSEV